MLGITHIFSVEVLCTPRVVLPCKNGAMLKTALFFVQCKDGGCTLFILWYGGSRVNSFG